MTDKTVDALRAMDDATLRTRLAQCDAMASADVALRDSARHYIGQRGLVKGIVSGERLDTAVAGVRRLVVTEMDRRGIRP